MTDRLRVGVIGCGLIAQVMHLPYLRELDDRFEVVALCDLSQTVVDECARRFGIGRAVTSWEAVVAADVDAVLVLTSGSHAPIAVAAASAGLHVFVEKPMCFSVEEGVEMLDAARRAGVCLMVGYMKRFDPAVDRLREELSDIDEVSFVRVTTLESPIEPYVAHYPLVAPATPLDAGVLHRLHADDERRILGAIGSVDRLLARVYRSVLLDSVVHELNLLRDLLGEPDRLDHVSLTDSVVTAILTFGGVQCVLAWVDLPGIARYRQELVFYAPDRRATLAFPSPFLRSEPTELTLEAGDIGTSRSWRTVETTSYDEAFKRELVEFHTAILDGRSPLTTGEDGLRDIALCRAMILSNVERRPVDRPSEPRVATLP